MGLVSTRERCIALAWRWGFSMKNLILIVVMSLIGCRAENNLDCETASAGVPCSDRTKDEDARVALNNGDLETAVVLLKELVEAEPLVYKRYPLLAAALAGRAGLDIFNIVQADFGGSTPLIETMGAFLPNPSTKGDAFEDSLADMSEAVSTLKAVPADLRSDISGDSFAASCSVQLILYQSAYATMLINKYTYGSSGFDPSKLSEMTAEDAALILSQLLSAAQTATGSSGEAASAAVQKTYDSIQGQSGANDQEKIAAYVKGNK